MCCQKWGVLSGFGHFAGGSYYENGKQPDVMLLSDWKKIVQYYISSAPDSLVKTTTGPFEGQLKNFDVSVPIRRSIIRQLLMWAFYRVRNYFMEMPYRTSCTGKNEWCERSLSCWRRCSQYRAQ